MFSKIIELLKAGELPSSAELSARLKPAMVKKGGVMNQPRLCWSNDPKINPDAVHMLWAAILLGDHEMVLMVVGMVFVEQGYELAELTPEIARELIVDKGSDLVALAPNHESRKILAEKVNGAADSIYRG